MTDRRDRIDEVYKIDKIDRMAGWPDGLMNG